MIIAIIQLATLWFFVMRLTDRISNAARRF